MTSYDVHMSDQFSGSYASDDVQLLLNPLSDAAIARLYEDSKENKERLIQQGLAHYSEMLSPESPPAPEYLWIFDSAMNRHGHRVAQEISAIAQSIDEKIDGPVTLCSLVRAGLPMGVLLKRALQSRGRDVQHYGLSIVRDKGLDVAAVNKVLETRPVAGVVFVDGWTGKGAIADELEKSVSRYGHGLEPRLVTLADTAGRAWLSASHEDWLIPSGILGSTVSGLISRSVITPENKLTNTLFHGTAYLRNLQDSDISRRYVDDIAACGLNHTGTVPTSVQSTVGARQLAESTINAVAQQYEVVNRNRIKPGIAEATRAVLRRVPYRILIANRLDPDLEGILYLADQQGVLVEEVPTLTGPYRAITIIKDVAAKQTGSTNS